MEGDSKCVRCGKVGWSNLCTECTKAANDAVVYTHINIGPELFDKWEKLYSGDLLANDRARGILTYQDKSYVVWGSMSNALDTHEVVLAKLWQGPTLSYVECIKTNVGGGPFFENNHKFKCEGQAWVCVPDRVTVFHKVEEPTYKQMSMF